MCALLFVPQPAIAAILCVTPGGTSGCSSTIGAAVAAAAANDIIVVAAGTYKEDVVIGKPLSLIGENKLTTVIDAALPHTLPTVSTSMVSIITGWLASR